MPKPNLNALRGKMSDAIDKAIQEHKNDPVNFGGGAKLPAGITNGVAKLATCGFNVVKGGDDIEKAQWTATGIILKPKVFTDKEGERISLRGLQTRKNYPLYDTPNRRFKTIGEHMSRILNELKKLDVDLSEVETREDLAKVMQGLLQEDVYFRFSTFEMNGFINEQWGGRCEYEEDESDAVEVVVDDIVRDTPWEQDDNEATSEPSLQELGEMADSGDESAQSILQDKAIAADLSKTQIEEAENWTAVALMIESPPAPQIDNVEKEDVWGYQAPGSTVMDCEVIAVFPAKRTVNLKRLEDGKSFKNVSWDDLVERK